MLHLLNFSSKYFRACALGVFALALNSSTAAETDQPKLIFARKIWDQGNHNAFTDLIRFRDAWFCTFREAEAHVGGDGHIRVLTSQDGEKWTSAADIGEQGIDLRDPKFSIAGDGRLMIVAGGSVYNGTKTLQGRQPRVMFSKDGKKWTKPEPVLSEGDWLWRVTWHKGVAYGASYDASAKPDWTLTLYSSNDGVKYEKVTKLDVPGHPNETTLRFLPGGEMMALVRREAGDTHGWIGTSQPPYQDWSWNEVKYRLGGPNFIQVPDGTLWAATRQYAPTRATVLARMTRDSLTPVLTLPSGGDTSYAGLAWHEGHLWMSYYASHEGKSAIYIAKIELPSK